VRRALALVGAVLLLASAGALLVLARDVRAWETRLEQDDLSFRHAPGRPALWQPEERFPGGAARRLLQIEDDLAFRNALRLFRLSRPRQLAYDRPALAALRGQAQVELIELGRHDPDAPRRSEAANLVGVLSLGVEGRESPTARATFLESGIANFQTAVQLDDSNERAKYNLELALRRQETDAASLESAGAEVPRDDPSGAGLREGGSGY
jgi:hypothetical protein